MQESRGTAFGCDFQLRSSAKCGGIAIIEAGHRLRSLTVPAADSLVHARPSLAQTRTVLHAAGIHIDTTEHEAVCNGDSVPALSCGGVLDVWSLASPASSRSGDTRGSDLVAGATFRLGVADATTTSILVAHHGVSAGLLGAASRAAARPSRVETAGAASPAGVLRGAEAVGRALMLEGGGPRTSSSVSTVTVLEVDTAMVSRGDVAAVEAASWMTLRVHKAMALASPRHAAPTVAATSAAATMVAASAKSRFHVIALERTRAGRTRRYRQTLLAVPGVWGADGLPVVAPDGPGVVVEEDAELVRAVGAAARAAVAGRVGALPAGSGPATAAALGGRGEPVAAARPAGVRAVPARLGGDSSARVPPDSGQGGQSSAAPAEWDERVDAVSAAAKSVALPHRESAVNASRWGGVATPASARGSQPPDQAWGSTALPERAAPAGLITVDLGDDGGSGSSPNSNGTSDDDDDSIDDDDDEGMLV